MPAKIRNRGEIMISLDVAQQEAFMSDYLQRDWKEEEMSFRSVSVGTGEIVALLDVHHYRQPADGRFHLSAQSALLWMSQLAIIYGCWDNKLPKKMGEVYLRSMTLAFNKPVTKTHAIEISANVAPECRRALPGGSIYYRDVKFLVEAGAFTGKGSFIVPTNT